MTQPDPYTLLQVRSNASTAVIDAAYKTLLKQYHPDMGGATVLAAELNEAHRILSNADLRAAYDASRPTLGGGKLSNYEHLEKIAEGGFATMYKATHRLTGNPVCIKHVKQISPTHAQIALDETRAIWDVNHFGLPAMRDVIEIEDGSYAIVMSFVPGLTLEQLVAEVRRHSPPGYMDGEDVIWIAARLLHALSYLQHRRIIHGDVKPQNIIIDPDTHNVVLVDFKLALINPTVDSRAKGYTHYFAAPEQMSDQPLFPETDLFGLGKCMIYALGGGNLEWVDEGKVPKSVPDQLVKFIHRLVEPEAKNRPNWNDEDIGQTLQQLRVSLYGRAHTGFRPIRGLRSAA